MVLSNGSIILVGGEQYNSGPAQANLEVIPRIPGGSTVLPLEWLLRTEPNNLYPFLLVLPSRNVLASQFGSGLSRLFAD